MRVSPRVILEGCYDPGSLLMTDHLRASALLPSGDPYGPLGYPFPGGTYSNSAMGVPTTIGSDAVVDRVVIELRDPTTPSQVVAARSVYVQRDGDVVDLDGASPVLFTMATGNYHVAVRHRNHFGVMAASAIGLSVTSTSVDFTNTATTTYGTSAQKQIGGKMVLWAGDATGNGTLQYTGANNDRDPILIAVGGTTPNNTLNNVYDRRDVNMDGVIKYTGANNDRDPILTNVGSTTPNTTRTQQLP